MNRRLHEITADFLALEDLLLEAGGEFTPEVEALIAEMEGNREAKVDGYAALIREWEADAEKWKAEEARVNAHRKARENAAQRMKERLCEELVAMGCDKVETPRFKVAVQRAASTVEVLADPTALPEEFRRDIPASVEADKRAIAEALKAGDASLDGLAQLNPGKQFVRIR
jgi:hypothetical protein